MRHLALAALAFAAALSSACTRAEDPEETTYYDRKIGPILQSSCATSPAQSSCHVAADDRGNALGNLDMSSYETLILRRDLLIDYGPYGMPTLLLRAAPPQTLRLTSWDNEAQLVTTDVAHAGGSLFDVTSVSFNTIAKWIEGGANKNNSPVENSDKAFSPCTSVLGQDPLFDPSVAPSTPDFATFRDRVNPVLGASCAAGNCHGNSSNSLYLTCGQSEEELRWNYFAASDYVSVEPAASEIVRRTLNPALGGTYHEGGPIFSDTNEEGYAALLAWATEKGGPSNVPSEAGFHFFAKRVQPMLVKRGCMQLNCHSSSMFHDYRLRGGSGGHFGLPATRNNYELTLQEVALESPNPNASRLIRKNLPPAPSGEGILHRGGALFANGGNPADCDLAPGGLAETGDLDDPALTPYCVLVKWLELERTERMGSAKPLEGIVYVKRPPAPLPDTLQDYATFAAGADLLLAPASYDASGAITASAGTSLLGQCGLSAGIDVRRPAVSWDGTKIAFAARASASEPLRVYVIDGSSCAVEPTIDAAPVDESGSPIDMAGELVHNFDPAFAPDGRIVFASTRGNLMNTGVLGSGPTRAPADPSKLNANLYILENAKIRQLTFVLNQETQPAFMSDGRVIFTAEKRAPGFYQLAGRRQNLDGADYHPLFGQRSTIDYDQFTDVVELSDQNLAAIFSDKGAVHGAGTLAIINRSIGVDQLSADPVDYTQDPDAIGWPNPAFYQRAIKLIDPAVSGKPGTPTSGAFRNPSPLPDGKLLVSFAPNVVDVANFNGRFEIVVVDSITGARSPLISDAADDLLWPTAVYARQNHGVFYSRLDEANGATFIAGEPDRAEVLVLDVAVLSSLLFQNTRTGRVLPDAPQLDLWQSLPPEPGVTAFGQSAFETSDEYGPLIARRALLGGVTVQEDDSAKVVVPGGAAVVFATNARLAGEGGEPMHHQREEMQFYPGEVARQSFPKSMFNGLCAGCHGALNGFETHISVDPDILTGASRVKARGLTGKELLSPGSPQAAPFP